MIKVSEHLNSRGEEGKTAGQHLAEHGLAAEDCTNILVLIEDAAPTTREAIRSAFLLGIQLGAMRLDPIEYVEPETEPCDCLICSLMRAAGEDPDADA